MERVGRDAKKPENRNANTGKTASPPVPNFAEVKEDFEQIQIINGEVLQASTSKADYQRISESAAEIKKRAIRLKSNLFPPKSTKLAKEKEPDAETHAEDQELKSLLTLLDNSISSFTLNPMFQNSKVVNPQDHENAQKELETVIKLSTRINNEAERLKKANSAPQ